MNHCLTLCCFVYRKGTIFQANHNLRLNLLRLLRVVLYTAKVRFFKQITTCPWYSHCSVWLFCIPQRYDFSSKSQHTDYTAICSSGCFVYRKGTIFQANHNRCSCSFAGVWVVLYTAKVRFFKQITTRTYVEHYECLLFCIPQRYDFSSKSQLLNVRTDICPRCFVYRKGTIFQANHNKPIRRSILIWRNYSAIPDIYSAYQFIKP